jgi:hypothetical protein
MFKQFSARYELGRYPIDNVIKKQSLLYEDRLLAVDTPETGPWKSRYEYNSFRLLV